MVLIKLKKASCNPDRRRRSQGAKLLAGSSEANLCLPVPDFDTLERHAMLWWPRELDANSITM